MPTSSLLRLHHASESESQAQQVGATPDLDSLPSEPPDIRNWFPSYVYESPELNSLDGLPDLDGYERTCIEGEKTDKFGGIAKEPSNGISGTGRNKPDCSNSREPAPASVVCDVEQKTSLPILNSLPLKRVDGQTLPGETECDPVLKPKATIVHDKEDDTELENCLIDRTNDNLLHMEHGKHNWDKQPHKKLITTNNISTEILEKENIRDALSPEGDSREGGQPIEIAKENNGFVSTRKKCRQEFTGSVIPRDGQQLVPNREKAVNKKSWNMFSDESNFHYPHTTMESTTGKWCCPQMKKPKLGPPLKQIRLERWIKRRNT